MKTIKEYLQNDPVSYDFSDDCTESVAYQSKKGYEKYFIYRSPKPDEKEIYPIAASVIEKNYQLYGTVGDPDAESNLLQSIYSLLWPEIQEEKSEYMINNKGWIFSDTMTSCQTVLNYYVKNKLPEVLKRYAAKHVSNLMCIELYETDAVFRELLEKSEDLKHLITVYHTLGNYIPVPYGFNEARSGSFASHDSWDLTLMKIKEYYDAKREILRNFGELFPCLPEIKIMELLHNREIISCYQWLNSFAGWEEFIDRNFLQDFVGSDYQPLPFCKGHSWKNPQISENFDEFFRNAWQMIEKRSRRMIKEIEKNENVNPAYDGLVR